MITVDGEMVTMELANGKAITIEPDGDEFVIRAVRHDKSDPYRIYTSHCAGVHHAIYLQVTHYNDSPQRLTTGKQRFKTRS